MSQRLFGTREISSWLLAALLLAAWPQQATAQAVYGSLAGTVTDSTGAALPGVTITITSLDRKTVDSVVSNAAGFFIKERLLPGPYEVKAELTGFKSAVVSRGRVGIDSQTKVDLQLEVGEIAESIIVTASTLKTDRADVSTTFDTKELTELPVLDRNFTKFVLLSPGTQSLQWSHAASENPQGSSQTMVNGQHFSGTGYQLDGTENRDPVLGIIVINPNLDSIGESKITSQNYDAEFGQATAGVVSVQTKSGTNEIHGSAFEFYQNDRFQARNPFTQPPIRDASGNLTTKGAIPETTRHQFGGSLGGPIQKNKWFFFADYQGLQSNIGGSRRLTVPTAAARNGDFSAYGINIYDPLTGQQFPGNVIPADRISPQARALLNLLPAPTLAGLRDNYTAGGSEAFDSNAGDVRLDGRLSDRINVFGRYSIASFTLDGPSAFGDGGGRELVTLGGTSKVRNHSVALGMDYTLDSTTILDVRFGFFKYGVDVLPFDFGSTPAADAGVPGLNLDDFSSGLSEMNIEGEFGFRMGSGLGTNRCNCPLTEQEKQAQVVANLTKMMGNHTFKFGVDVRRAWNLRVPSDEHRSGLLEFHHNRTSLNGQGGLGFATFLLGDVTFFQRYVSPNTNARERQWRHFYYAQDTWRVNSNLTVNYGLRADIINPQSVNEAGNGGWPDLSTGEMKVGGVGGIGLNGDVKNTVNWAPRLGLTWQLNEKTVVRAGYGRSYDIGVFGSTFGHTVTQNLPVLAIQQLPGSNGFQRVFGLNQGPPGPEFPQPGADGRFPIPNGIRPRVLPDKQRLPQLDAWNLTVQRQISDTLSVEAAYVGNKGTHVFAGDNPDDNANNPIIDGFVAGVPRDQRKPFFAGPILGLGGSFGWTQDVNYYCNCGDNSYNALQAKLTKRFSGGYQAQASYTLQRVRNDGDEGLFFFEQYRPVSYGRPDWDRVHNFILTGLAELPFGKGKRYLSDATGALNALVGGWQFNSNVIIQSGQPFSVDYAGGGADRDVGPNRADLIGDAGVGGGDGITAPYFDTTPIGTAGSPWGRPARGTYGNSGRNAFTGPGYWRVDGSLFKRFELGGSRQLEFRVEVVNLFNKQNYALNPFGGAIEVGSPGNARTNAGFITNKAYGAPPDPSRNVQFALRFTF